MSTKTRRFAIVLSILVLVGAAGAGTYWIYKRGLKRDGLYEKAERAFRQRKFDRAAELAREALVAEPNRELAQELLLEALVQAEKYDAAKKEATKYATMGKDFARVVLCRLAVHRGDIPEAERLARALTDTRPAFAHHILALLADNQGIATNNWQLRLAAANTMRGLAALTDREATRATALMFCAQITLEVAPFIAGSERLVQSARADLQSAVAAINKAYQTDHGYPYELSMGVVHSLSADENEAETGARVLRKYTAGSERREEVIATLALYHLRRKEWQETIDLVADIKDTYLWNRVFWVLRHGGHRDVALRVLEQSADAGSPVKRLMRADILLQGETAEDKAAAQKILEELIKDESTETAAVLRSLVLLALRADLETARKVAESAHLDKREDKRITALVAFLMNTDEENKGRAIELARDLAADINTVEESRDMIYLLGGGTDVMNSYLDAQVAKGGESGLQHRLRRALNNMGLASRDADSEAGKKAREKVVKDLQAVLDNKDATKGALIGAFSIASSVGETELAGRVLARALALPGNPDLLAVRILELAFRTVDQSVVGKLAGGLKAGADASLAPTFVKVFADLMLTKGQITEEHLDRLDGAAKAGDGSKSPALDLACRIAIGQGSMERAENYARGILDADSTASTGRQLLGAVLMRNKAYEQVIELYQGVNPLPEEGHYQCIGSLAQLGRRKEAFNMARTTLEKFPRSHVAYVVLARLHLDAEEVEKALAVLNVAPPNTFIAMMKGELLVRLKDYRMAEQQYEAILAQTGFTNQVAWGGLHEVLVRQDRAHDFIDITSKVLNGKVLKKDAPIRAAIHILRGQTLEAKGQVHEALADYEKAIALNATAWSALNNAAWHIAQLAPARIGDARKYIDAAMKLKPNEAALLDTAAEVYAVAGKIDEAIKFIDSCLMVAGEARTGEYLLHKAQILLRDPAREAEARELLNKIQTDYAETPLAKTAKDLIWKLDLKNMPDEEEKKDDGGEESDDGGDEDNKDGQ